MTPRSAAFANIALGIVTPMANERETAERFIREVANACAPFGFAKVTHFVILDRASTDGTLDLLQEKSPELLSLRLIHAPENRSVVDAYMRGYREALTANSDWILEIDAGFSHSPKNIPALFEEMIKGYDCVFGSRFCKGGSMRDAPMRRYLISRGGSIVANLLLGTGLSDMTGGYELFTRTALERILARGILSRGPFFQTEIKAFAREMKICEVPIQYTSPSHVVGSAALNDAASGLLRLFRLRITNSL